MMEEERFTIAFSHWAVCRGDGALAIVKMVV